MSRIIILILVHLCIYFFAGFWWSNAAIAVIFGFIFYKSIPAWLQTAIVAGIVLVHSSLINSANEGRLADQLIQVFGLSQGWLLIVFSVIVLSLSVLLGQWMGRSIRTNIRPIEGR